MMLDYTHMPERVKREAELARGASPAGPGPPYALGGNREGGINTELNPGHAPTRAARGGTRNGRDTFTCTAAIPGPIVQQPQARGPAAARAKGSAGPPDRRTTGHRGMTWPPVAAMMEGFSREESRGWEACWGS